MAESVILSVGLFVGKIPNKNETLDSTRLRPQSPSRWFPRECSPSTPPSFGTRANTHAQQLDDVKKRATKRWQTGKNGAGSRCSRFPLSSFPPLLSFLSLSLSPHQHRRRVGTAWIHPIFPRGLRICNHRRRLMDSGFGQFDVENAIKFVPDSLISLCCSMGSRVVLSFFSFLFREGGKCFE